MTKTSSGRTNHTRGRFRLRAGAPTGPLRPSSGSFWAVADSPFSYSSESDRYLGSEDDLLARFGISRPTLRQAARMVANDRLIAVRRGSGGGFYATRPDAADSVRALARYLRLRGASLSDILVVTRSVSEQAAVLAAACKDAELRGELLSFAARIDGNDSPAAIVRAETYLARILAAMMTNGVDVFDERERSSPIPGRLAILVRQSLAVAQAIS